MFACLIHKSDLLSLIIVWTRLPLTPLRPSFVVISRPQQQHRRISMWRWTVPVFAALEVRWWSQVRHWIRRKKTPKTMVFTCFCSKNCGNILWEDRTIYNMSILRYFYQAFMGISWGWNGIQPCKTNNGIWVHRPRSMIDSLCMTFFQKLSSFWVKVQVLGAFQDEGSIL